MNLDAKKIKLLIGALVGIGVVIYFSQTVIEKKEQEGRSALYKIQKTYEDELKALPEAEKTAGVTLDVDAKFSKTVSELKGLIQGKALTDHTLFEATSRLGNLYLEHNQPKQAQEAFNQGFKFASGSFQKASILLLLGFAEEQSQQFKEAVETYNKGLQKGFEGLKSEFLFGLVRNHVKLNQKDKAKIFAEKLNQEFSGSRAATEAQEMVK